MQYAFTYLRSQCCKQLIYTSSYDYKLNIDSSEIINDFSKLSGFMLLCFSKPQISCRAMWPVQTDDTGSEVFQPPLLSIGIFSPQNVKD